MNLAVFDIDGTLIKYHKKRNDQAYIRAIKETFGIKIEDSWSGYVHSTDSGIFSEIIEKELGRPSAPGDVEAVKKNMASWLEKEYGTEPFEGTPGAEDCLNGSFVDSNWFTAIATGNWEFSGAYKLNSAGLDFKKVPLASADDGISREIILQAALSKAKRAFRTNRFEKIVYVGDWIWDVKAARALGWGFVGIGSGEVEKAIREAGAEHVLPNFSGILESLNRCIV